MLRERGETLPEQMAAAVVPADIIGFLDGGERAIGAAKEAIAYAGKIGSRAAEESIAYPEKTVKLLAPIPRPRKLLMVGLNYRDHAQESGNPLPEYPTFFMKGAVCVTNPGDPIEYPRVSKQLDYEAEMAFVIGKRGRHIPKEKALEYVAGYTIVNDVSVRDYQHRGQWTMGKNFENAAPMGPYLVLKDEIPDPHVLDVSCFLNGERVQHSNTKQLIFDVNYLVNYISECVTIEPGDVVSTGTPSGVGLFRTPQLFMKPGDVVRIEVGKIGVLENRIVGE
ncbi:MAG: fumarylacetoacetate hydrolase family protein [Candidatus Binataceae bacterium]|nr:fumarylacetoacetate hydrolase family protein [Candidatus Binataceae bacterium]